MQLSACQQCHATSQAVVCSQACGLLQISAGSDSKALSSTLAVLRHCVSHAEHQPCSAPGRCMPEPVHLCSSAACVAWTQVQDCQRQCLHLLLMPWWTLHRHTDHCNMTSLRRSCVKLSAVISCKYLQCRLGCLKQDQPQPALGFPAYHACQREVCPVCVQRNLLAFECQLQISLWFQ